MNEVQWELMFPDQLEQAFQTCPLLYFTYGLCEPHGPHNALGLDELKAHAIAVRAAQRHGGIVAPPDFWHIHEIGGYAIWSDTEVGRPPRTWLTAMPPWQHFKNICYHIRQADALGFKAAILFTGHYGPNWQDLNELVRLLQPIVGTRLYSLPEFEANYKGFSGDGSQTGDHAGKVETSLLWALRPDCVDASRIPAEYHRGEQMAMGQDAPLANRLIGERMVADEVEWLGAKGRELLAEYDRLQPAHTFTTFEAVEQAWSERIAPRLPEFITMQEKWSGQSDLPADSPWGRNNRVPNNWR
ncbi:MAG: creatininase family protein [Desulfobacterales bacterium]|nr:creatininase family protein [Desulfobacterales bacterium]